MNPLANAEWWFIASGWALISLALLLAVWALIGDRSRDRRRCPKCWYDMAGASSLACPECGRTAKSESHLRRTRRRWRFVMLALVLLVGGQSLRLGPGISREGWLSPLPLWAVLHLLPMGGMDGPVGLEFQRRVTGFRGNVYLRSPDPLTIEERAAIIRRCARGNLVARPASERWQRSYGKLLKRHGSMLYWRTHDGRIVTSYENGEETPILAAAVDELFDVPPVLRAVQSRDRWPASMPVAIRFEVDHWWPMQCSDDVVIRWSANGGPPSEPRTGRLQFEFDIPATGRVELDLDIDVRQTDGAKEGRPVRIMKKEHRRLVYQTTSHFDEVITPVRDPAVDQLLSSSLSTDYSVDRGVFWLHHQALDGQGLDDVAFGARAEILHHGEIISVSMIRFTGNYARGVTIGGGARVRGLGKPWREAQEYIRAHKDEPGWEMRLTSDPQWAILMLDAERYWDGEATFPLTFGNAMPGFPPQRAPAAAPSK